MNRLIQLRYEFRGVGRPTRGMVEEIGREWIKTGKTPAGVKIKPIFWGQDGPRDLRRHLAGRKVAFGCPGLVKLYAAPNLTMLDFDTDNPVSLMRVWRVAACLGIKPRLIRYDRTRRGWHVIVYWNRKFSPAETVALQAILGSDPAREMFNLARVLSGKASNPRWNLLFKFKLR